MSDQMTPQQEMAAMIERSRKAQEQIADYSQEQVDELIRAMVYAVAREDRAEEIAQFTVDETQLGNSPCRRILHHLRIRCCLR